MRNQKGQVVIILLLVMLVALTIGLSIVQNSINDIASSTKTEQSSRAFSAAEAGIEKALLTQTNVASFSLGNESSATVLVNNNLPLSNQGLEYPPIGKLDFAHFWLADPNNNLVGFYTDNSFTVYFGNCDLTTPTCLAVASKPAIEVNVITEQASSYRSFKYYFDSQNLRTPPNNFQLATCSNSGQSPINTTTSSSSIFYCKATINGYIGVPILARVRILYSDQFQKLAVLPSANKALPPQAAIYKATGSAGNIQRKITIFRVQDVVPYFFDFAIFSAGEIKKE
ncbi:pilus assembly PilX N-terminal domain-containing protein [Candidatus Daviesbacteria bacterium]|nr:pilus assembly PilX N-terminal domain-containing protein [Candidatus Daviesbacteria bacterium]